MGLRYTLYILLLIVWPQSEASSIRNRRQLPSDSQSYQPPLLLPALPQQNSYQPPLGRSVDSSIRHLESIAPAAAATSYSVHQQPSYSEASGLQHNSADTHSKAVSHVPIQSIHKAPASEIQAEKASPAKEKDNKNDEYIVYYYYYYDNDTTPNNNLSLNFDDIPSLESYDDDKKANEPQKSASARTLATNINSVLPVAEDQKVPSLSDFSSSQPRSASGHNKETVFKPDRKESGFDDTVAQPFKPVSNVFRYGSNEVPRFPVLPNFIVSETQTTTNANIEMTPQSFDHAAQPQTHSNSQYSNLNHDEDEDDAANNVLDSASSIRVSEDKSEEEDITTTVAPTTEPPTTTEIPTTTTTEKSSRRRPSIGGGRRRFNPSQPSSFSSNRARTPSRGSTSSTSTTSTTTTTSTPPTRRSFQGSNRVRPRPSFNSNRGRTGSRTTSASDSIPSSSSESTTTQSTTTAKARFTSSPRRFQSSRSRSPASSTSTTRPPSSPSPSRSRPTSRRPNLISRSRPGRPGFPRSRPSNEIETTEATTPEPEETSPSSSNENVSPDVSVDNVSEVEETSEEPTTTEASRFSALFRPRNRNALGNRPRPIVGNRPSRS